jgi:hypothetical protein
MPSVILGNQTFGEANVSLETAPEHLHYAASSAGGKRMAATWAKEIEPAPRPASTPTHRAIDARSGACEPA